MKRRKKAGAVVLAVMLALMPVWVLGGGADAAAGEIEVTARAAARALMPVRVLGGGTDAAAGEIEVTARAAVAMEAETGRVLYEKNADEVLPMASTTKVMTALVVLENAELDDRVEIDGRMAGIEGSSMNLDAGEELTVEQLLYGLMLRSGNDAAVALALHVAGSVEGFAEKMNAKAAEMGLMHTHFCNPHGLPAQGHETTARELARIAAEAWKHEEFRRIVGTKSITVPWKGRGYDRAMKNKNKLLTLLPGGNGIKTGYTKAAGRCLVGGAERGGMQLITVVLNAPDMWNDTIRIMEEEFAQVRKEQVVQAGEICASVPLAWGGKMPAAAAESAYLPLREGEKAEIEWILPETIESAVAVGQNLGYAKISVKGDGEILCEIPLICAESAAPPERRYADAVREIARGWVWREVIWR